MKQTAVEWLEQHLYLDDNWKRIFEQAKEVEEQHIIEAYNAGLMEQGNSIDYYNKTFKK